MLNQLFGLVSSNSDGIVTNHLGVREEVHESRLKSCTENKNEGRGSGRGPREPVGWDT